MSVPAATFVGNLDSSRPTGSEGRFTSDDYHRNTQESVRMSFPNVTGEVSATHTELNTIDGYTGSTADLNMLSGRSGTSVVAMVGETGTIAVFIQASAPSGWTITTAFDGKALFVKGVVDADANPSGEPGGATGGADDPGRNKKLPDHRHFVAIDGEVTYSPPSQLSSSNSISRRWNLAGAQSSVEYNLTSGAGDPDVGRTSQSDATFTGQFVPRWVTTIACTLT